MNRTQAIARIQRTLGYRSDQTLELIDALQDAQRQLEQGTTLPWFLNEPDGSLTTVAGAPDVDLPERFIREAGDVHIEGAILEKYPMGELVQTYYGADPAQPEYYALGADAIRLFPTPDDAYTIAFPYWKGAAELTNDAENAWLRHAPFVIIGAAGLLVAADRRNQTAVAKFQSMLDVGWQALWIEQGQRETAGRKIVMGRKA